MTLRPVPAGHPLASLLTAALTGGEPLSEAVTRLVFAHALNDGGVGAAALYVRRELSADQAALLWDKHAVGVVLHADRRPVAAAAWQARRLMRPESRPENLTAGDVTAWPAGVAYEVANMRTTPWRTIPDAVFAHLMCRPELGTALNAAMGCPQHPTARDIVAKVGAFGAAAFPGLHLPAPGPLSDLNVLKDQSGEDGPRVSGRTIRAAIGTVGRVATPPALVEFAALTWTSPACLSALPTGALSAAAAGRVARLWLVPSVEMLGATLAARALAKASTEIVPALDAVVVRTLAAAWMGSGLLNGLAADRHPALALAFASAGVPLTRPVSDEQVVSLEALNHAQRLELVALVERGAEATPGLWDTLGLALTTAGGMGGTWGQLLDALAGIHTRPAGP